jgi:hypothetical protein
MRRRNNQFKLLCEAVDFITVSFLEEFCTKGQVNQKTIRFLFAATLGGKSGFSIKPDQWCNVLALSAENNLN